MFDLFKRKKGIKLTYNQQGFVYFLCMNYDVLPASTKSLIKKLCDEVGGFNSLALFVFLTDPYMSSEAISQRYFVSVTRLGIMRAEFYERFYKKIKKK